MMRPMKKNYVLVCVVALLASACSDTGDEDNTASVQIPATEAQAAMATYAQIVSASYEDSVTTAQALDAAIETLTATPSAENLEAARDAWLASREPYLQTEVYRFYDGPIDNPDDGPEGLLNAWPMDENYVDYTSTEPTAGIVNDSSVNLEASVLEGLNEAGGEKNISTGYHAIEFILWGQDLSADGAGERPHTDFIDGAEGTAENQARRSEFLKVVSDKMVADLNGLVSAWADGQNNYRAEFLAAGESEGVRRVLTGMIVLSGFETGGERLQTALDSGDQEDEHSCFSDNTHRDMVQDVRGVQNVWLGTYTRLDGSTVSGTGIRDVVAAVDSALAQQITDQIAESLRLAEALQPPFDQEIASGNAAGRTRVEALIQSLRDQEGLLEQVFLKFNLSIPEPE